MSGNSVKLRTSADDGTIEEVTGHGDFHLELTDSTTWWLTLGDVTLSLSARGKIIAMVETNPAAGHDAE
jgi:hypothetical protein